MTDTDFQLTPPALPASVPIAHVFGQPVLEVPQDLFIPPDALQLILESFEGPLDLLLYLIRKQNLDVLNIPMAEVTAQYMGYIDAMRDGRLELAAEYLLMAALLIEIKSRLLLPRPPVEGDDDPDDPRAELVRRLLEYEQMKLAALALDKLPQADRDFAWLAVLVEQSAEAAPARRQPAGPAPGLAGHPVARQAQPPPQGGKRRAVGTRTDELDPALPGRPRLRVVRGTV